MDLKATVRSLQTGLSESLSIIKYLKEKYGDKDPIIEHAVQQIAAILKYSEHIYDEHPAKKHSLYDN